MNTGFSTESFPETDTERFLHNIGLTPLTEEPDKRAIECFAVNKEGQFAIGCADYEIKTVCVYAKDGTFRRGYRFHSSGIIGVDLDGDTLLIYFVRSALALAVSPTGEVEEVLAIQNTIENEEYWNRLLSTTRKMGDTTYKAKNDMGILNLFASSHSQLVYTDAAGVQSILYDVNATHLSHTRSEVTRSLVFISMVIAVVGGLFIVLNLPFAKFLRRKWG